MREISLVLIGVLSATILASTIYLLQAAVKIYISKKKLKNVLVQIKAQIDIKYDLLKEYIEDNREDIGLSKYEEINKTLEAYNHCLLDNVEVLKDYDDLSTYYVSELNDVNLSEKCKIAQDKIDYIRSYYNELVCYHNQYKSNRINSILAKAISPSDEKLY